MYRKKAEAKNYTSYNNRFDLFIAKMKILLEKVPTDVIKKTLIYIPTTFILLFCCVALPWFFMALSGSIAMTLTGLFIMSNFDDDLILDTNLVIGAQILLIMIFIISAFISHYYGWLPFKGFFM